MLFERKLKMSRFGNFTLENINETVRNSKPINTARSQAYIWSQFMEFCTIRNYELLENTPEEDLANILQDWAFNMRKKDGTEYKEGVVKLVWNVSAKLLQTKYFDEFKRLINPFNDQCFEKARAARDTKRKELQRLPEKRKVSAAVLTATEIESIAMTYDEDTPDGLQKKFFQIASTDLEWRGINAVYCLIDYFRKQTNKNGIETGQIEYQPPIQKGSTELVPIKYLIPNTENENLCPVRLFNKLMSKRTENITTRRLFLTPNKHWQNSVWYKNIPVGINELSKWIRLGAEKIGLDTKRKKFTSHSIRSWTVPGHMATTSIESDSKSNQQHSKIISGFENSNSNSSSALSISETSEKKFNIHDTNYIEEDYKIFYPSMDENLTENSPTTNQEEFTSKNFNVQKPFEQPNTSNFELINTSNHIEFTVPRTSYFEGSFENTRIKTEEDEEVIESTKDTVNAIERQALALEEANKLRKRKILLTKRRLKLKEQELLLQSRFVDAIYNFIEVYKNK